MKRPGTRLKILFTEGSSTSARQALYCLGPSHTIDILDPSRFCQCRFSRFVRRWYRCPSFSRDPQGYLDALLERLEQGDYDILFPTHEQVFLLSRVQERLQDRVHLAVPPFDALDRLMNKARFFRLLDELQIPQPVTRIVRDRAELLNCDQFPCWVKIDYSTAGQGVRQVKSREQLELVADEFVRQGWLGGRSEVLVQQPARGSKGGASAVFRRGRMVAAHTCQGRAIGVGGSSMAQLSIARPRVLEALERLGQHLEFHGAMAVEHFSGPGEDDFQLLECNPRIGETVNALCSGVNLCEALVQASLEKDPVAVSPWREGIRSHQGFLILTARCLEGAGRWQLLEELWAAAMGRGLYASSEDELTRPGSDWISVIPYLAVTSLLLIRPQAAQSLVSRTVENYSLHQDAADRIRRL